MNVSGLCSRMTCPLANSNYASVREDEGRDKKLILGQLYLYIKTIERSHAPSKMWERVKLSKNYSTVHLSLIQALGQIDKELEFWPEFLIHKNKQRLTKLTQMLIRFSLLLQNPG